MSYILLLFSSLIAEYALHLGKCFCAMRESGANVSDIMVLQAAERAFVSGSAEKL
jgi:hypothetical protein